MWIKTWHHNVGVSPRRRRNIKETVLRKKIKSEKKKYCCNIFHHRSNLTIDKQKQHRLFQILPREWKTTNQTNKLFKSDINHFLRTDERKDEENIQTDSEKLKVYFHYFERSPNVLAPHTWITLHTLIILTHSVKFV